MNALRRWIVLIFAVLLYAWQKIRWMDTHDWKHWSCDARHNGILWKRFNLDEHFKSLSDWTRNIDVCMIVVVVPIMIVVGNNKGERQSEKGEKPRKPFVVLNKGRNTNHECCRPSNTRELEKINNFLIIFIAHDSWLLYVIRTFIHNTRTCIIHTYVRMYIRAYICVCTYIFIYLYVYMYITLTFISICSLKYFY